MPEKPQIKARKQVARTRLFCVEELELEFSNGEKRIYERMVSGGSGAVMIVPVTERNELVLIREYSAGTDDYQLAFPKGLMDDGESVFEAANRELKEEIGFGARQLQQLKSMTLAPGYFTHKMNLVLAQSLYPEKLEGDEPEPLEVVYWPISKIDGLIEQADFTEARSIAALLMVERYFKKG
ncbi:ADP compounds hydrolase NudE [Aliikangiella coralliicola]|uniref:ADP compounds hydrolase NudE n=1 Tax=Aliikangiella coralliicola TaxID=2592383 RepID=A0A545U7P8_9GAMM|nr:ADP compounds hydrolase NudE [Aliikangiella coralliicola]TQV85494.1 ADP compounds hydrolase NudE [Aliikangiella coralliicola]